MALRGTLTHWKTRVLAQHLGIMQCQALGILEALWHATAELAPAGNIGRLPNKAIALEMYYDGSPDELIAALIASGHLDQSEEHRLVVHDWSTYADDATDNKLARLGSRYATGEMPRMKRLSKQEREQLSERFSVPCAQNATAGHEKPLPVPVPVPDPVPDPGAAAVPEKKTPSSSSQKMASQIMRSLVLTEHFLEKELPKACEAAIRKHPELSPETLAEFMVDQRRKYLGAADEGKLSGVVLKPERFYAENHWESSAGWNWKEGKRPQQEERRYFTADGKCHSDPPLTALELFLESKSPNSQRKPPVSSLEGKIRNQFGIRAHEPIPPHILALYQPQTPKGNIQ